MGVITKDGQFEVCNHCGAYVEIHKLEYGYSPRWPNELAVDLCPECYKELKETTEDRDD